MGTPEWRATSNPHHYTKGWRAAAGVPGLQADGMDVMAVKQVRDAMNKQEC